MDDGIFFKGGACAQTQRGDCLELMRGLPDKSVDLILCDLPYGTTRNAWDAVIPFPSLWREYERIARGAIVLTAAQPFTSSLIASNLPRFKYCWIWEKSRVTGVLNAKHQPLRNYEDIAVFSSGRAPYNPQGLETCDLTRVDSHESKNYGGKSGKPYRQTQTGYPRQVLRFGSATNTVHPTQKPVELMEYLIKTYTDGGGVVLDNCMGSGTTGVACMNTGRNFIGYELDETYFAISNYRIFEATQQKEAA